jgi:hypothetical protein
LARLKNAIYYYLTFFNHNGRNNKSNHDNIFYEWLNPTTKTGGGAYPFRTGISAYRLTSFEIMSEM